MTRFVLFSLDNIAKCVEMNLIYEPDKGVKHETDILDYPGHIGRVSDIIWRDVDELLQQSQKPG